MEARPGPRRFLETSRPPSCRWELRRYPLARCRSPTSSSLARASHRCSGPAILSPSTRPPTPSCKIPPKLAPTGHQDSILASKVFKIIFILILCRAQRDRARVKIIRHEWKIIEDRRVDHRGWTDWVSGMSSASEITRNANCTITISSRAGI